MELRKIILRYLDGRTVPAFAPIFDAGTDPISVADIGGLPLRVPLDELKAVFYVRTFSGNPEYDPIKDPADLPRPPNGRVLVLDFKDGERIYGDVPEADVDASKGFFVTVLDPEDNNLLLYVNPGSLSAPPSRSQLPGPGPGSPEALFGG